MSFKLEFVMEDDSKRIIDQRNNERLRYFKSEMDYNWSKTYSLDFSEPGFFTLPTSSVWTTLTATSNASTAISIDIEQRPTTFIIPTRR